MLGCLSQQNVSVVSAIFKEAYETLSVSQGSIDASDRSVGGLALLSGEVSADGSISGELTTARDFCSSLNFQRLPASNSAIATPYAS